MIGKVVKIILMIQAVFGVIAGLILVVSPTIFNSTGLNTDLNGMWFIGVIVIAFEGFLLVGLSKLHEK